MFIFVYGMDALRVREREAELRAAFGLKHDQAGMNVDVFTLRDGGDEERRALGGVLANMPFMSAMRMVVVRGIFDVLKKANFEDWQRLLQYAPSSTVVLFSDVTQSTAVAKTGLIEGLGKDVTVYPIEALQGPDLMRWTQIRAKKYGANLTTAQLRELIARCAEGPEEIDGVLQKLGAYAMQAPQDQAQPHPAVVDEAAFEALVPDLRSEEAPFGFLDALSRRRAAEALRLWSLLSRRGTEPQAMFGLLARQVRLLCEARGLLDEQKDVRKDVLAQKLGLAPFVAQKLLDSAKNFDMPTLERLHARFVEADGMLKRGVEGSLVLDALIAQFLV